MNTKKYRIVKPKDAEEWPVWIHEMDPLDNEVIEHRGYLNGTPGPSGGIKQVRLNGNSYFIHHSWLVPCANLTLIRKVRL